MKTLNVCTIDKVIKMAKTLQRQENLATTLVTWTVDALKDKELYVKIWCTHDL